MKSPIELSHGEEIIKKVRKSTWSYSGRIFFGLLFVLIPLFFMLPLLYRGNLGIGLFVASVSFGFYCWLKVGWLLRRNYLLITSLGLVDVDVRRPFRKRVQRHDFSQLEGLKWRRRHWWQQLFDYGDIVFKIWGRSGVLILRSVPDPSGLKDLLVATIQEYWKSKQRMTHISSRL